MNGIRLEKRGPLAVLRMDKARGNAIDPPLVEALVSACEDVGGDDGVRGMLLASAHPKIFCPGLDLVTLYTFERPALEAFILRFGDMVRALYGLRKPLVAAIGGHAVAGGCILALTADQRILRRGAQIGLNEVRIGLPLPWPVAVLLRSSVPPTSLLQVALIGRNFADEEAVGVGLVDGLADAEGFEEHCLARLEELSDKDPHAFGTTKRYLRAEALRQMEADDRDLARDFLDGWFSPATRDRMRQMVESLTKAR